MGQFFLNKIAIAKVDKDLKVPRINNKQLATNPIKNTQGKLPTQYPTLVAEAKFNNIANKIAEKIDPKVQSMLDEILKNEGTTKTSPETFNTKYNKLGDPVRKLDSSLSDEHISNPNVVHSTTARNMLWNEYKGSLTRDEFEKMLDGKQANIEKQKIKDKNAPKILEFGLGGKRMVKDDSYSDLSDYNLDRKLNIELLDDEKYDKKLSLDSLGEYNPAVNTISVRKKTVNPSGGSLESDSDTASHELRHALHPFTGKHKENAKLYEDYPTSVRGRHVHDYYVNNPDQHQTDHHLVDLGLIHSLYVKHGNKPVINEKDTDNFMDWYKNFKQKDDGNYLFKFDPDSKLDEKFIRRNIPLVVENNEKPKDTKVASFTGKFFKIAQAEKGSNRPYAPVEVPLPAPADVPEVRPNPIRNIKPLTTSSKSSLDSKPKKIKLAGLIPLFKSAQKRNSYIVNEEVKKRLTQQYIDQGIAPDSTLASYGVDKDYYVGLGGEDTSFWDPKEDKKVEDKKVDDKKVEDKKEEKVIEPSSNNQSRYERFKTENWTPIHEPWYDEDEAATYGWSGGKWNEPETIKPDNKKEDPQINLNNNINLGNVVDSLNTNNLQIDSLKNNNNLPLDSLNLNSGPNANKYDKWYGDRMNVTVDSIRHIFGKEPRKLPNVNIDAPADTIGQGARDKIFRDMLRDINEKK